MSLIWRDTVTLVHRRVAGRDRYGNDVYEETREILRGCSWQPVSSSEEHDQNRDTITSYYRVYVRGLVPVDGVAAVEYDDPVQGLIRCEVHGQPEPNPSPTGRITHTVIPLKRVRG